MGDPTRKPVEEMDVDPVDLPEIVGGREPATSGGSPAGSKRKELSLPQRAALTVSCGLEGVFHDWAAIRSWAVGIADTLQAGV